MQDYQFPEVAHGGSNSRVGICSNWEEEHDDIMNADTVYEGDMPLQHMGFTVPASSGGHSIPPLVDQHLGVNQMAAMHQVRTLEW